jgi:serine protease inhibitor
MKRLVSAVVCAALALGATGCSRAVVTTVRSASPLKVDVAVAAEPPRTGDAAKAVHSPLARPQTAFGFELLRRTRTADSGNVLVSPVSVSAALAMTANGANGRTRSEMERVLGIDALGRDGSNAAYANLLRALNAQHEATLTVADSLWADSSLAANEDFLARDRDFFGAQLTRIPFADKARMAATVNEWVSTRTHGKIPDLLDPSTVDPATVMELVDAVYFKGVWADPFHAQLTQPRAFGLRGYSPPADARTAVFKSVMVPTMQRTGEMPYLETPQFQAVELPYKGKLSMYVFLPAEGSSLAAFEASLTPQAWSDWMSRFSAEEGTLELPKFTLRAKSELSKPLSAMGMPTAFDPKADFTGIAKEGLRISRIDHSVYVSVDETGTEAAAATAVGMMGMSAAPSRPFEMSVDRPFFFAIVDKPSGAPLFFGSVTDPRAK